MKYVYLIIPCVIALATPLYNSIEPRLFGFPFFFWFQLGGDLYAAYPVIAVPALVYSVGAYGFFAVPYTIVVYPFIFLTMPRLWSVAHRRGFVTAADFAQGRYGNRWLELAVALTG